MTETTTQRSSPQALAWLICALAAAALFGNFYVYDSIGPVADLLQQKRGFSDSQIGLLNGIYSLPNIALTLVGGVLVDRFGAARMTLITSIICLAGAALTAYSPDFYGMAAGRLLFGIGGETFNIATLAAITDYFALGRLAFAMALTLSISRLGSYSADMSTSWFADAYARGWQPPLEIAVVVAATSVIAAFIYWRIDRIPARSRIAQRTAEPFHLRDLWHFGRAYWYLLLLCVLWYSVILAFRSTFSIKYFQQVHNLDLATAGSMNSYVYLAAVFATPLFGWMCDRVGRYAPFLAFGAILLPISLTLMMTLGIHGLWMATALLGVSYSLVPAVMWPLTSRLVSPQRFGTALGLMWVIQNAGIFFANVIAGYLNDSAGASAQNPGGYNPMMDFFWVTSAAGCVCALLLWWTAGRKQHELPAAKLVP